MNMEGRVKTVPDATRPPCKNPGTTASRVSGRGNTREELSLAGHQFCREIWNLLFQGVPWMTEKEAFNLSSATA